MKSLNRILFLGLTAMSFGLASCDKTKPYDVAVAPPEAHFTGNKFQAYSAADDPSLVLIMVPLPPVDRHHRIDCQLHRACGAHRH